MTIGRSAFLMRIACAFVSGFLAGLSLAGWAGAARAHGDADWIMRNPTTAYCCNEKDCRQVAGGEVERIDGGWRVLDTGQVFEDGKTVGVQPAIAQQSEGSRHHAKTPRSVFWAPGQE